MALDRLVEYYKYKDAKKSETRRKEREFEESTCRLICRYFATLFVLGVIMTFMVRLNITF